MTVRSRTLGGVAAAAAAALALTGAAPASASGGSPESAMGADRASMPVGLPGVADTKKVTLITGDQVWLTRAKDESGKTRISTRIEAAKRPSGRKITFAQWGTAKQFFVVPSDVAPLVGPRVDPRIFDVAGLIDSGAGGSSSTRVIVSMAGPSTRSASALDASASELTARAKLPAGAVLSSANAVALSVPAGKAARLFEQLAPGDRGVSAVGTSGAAFVSLDGRVKALDTTSMPQIGAPSAWKSGFTGKGVRVAVLDTGVDATHPDLKGQVVAAKNFSGSNTASDRDGHGTHVASIVAGTGKAGGPGMRGVAYQAKLLNGKVLSDDGKGYDSDIIRGMEWAAKSGADVINMSLGGGPGEGIDPMEKSVNALSKKYGVVFAIAAGNNGEEGDGLVSSPSTADEAISVAAVDSKNKIATFSDSGPRTGDSALKPDVAAPGVDIRAARSRVNAWGSGSSPYVAVSGTSMAAPHVAGAAAVLAQARPDLSGAELKSALMGGASDRSGTVWEEGTGVVNIPASINMPVVAERGSLSFGRFAYPQSKVKPVTKTLRYRNMSSTPVTLKLKTKVSGANGVTARGVNLSAYGITVPANGTASVRVTVAPSTDPQGTYAGAITATPSTGHAIRTTIGWNNDVQRFNVTFKAVDPKGKPARAGGIVFDAHDAPAAFESLSFVGTTTMKLPAGTYFAGAFLYSPPNSPEERLLGIEPEFTVKGNTTITLGGPKSRRMTVKTPRPATPAHTALTYVREDAAKTEPFLFFLEGEQGGADLWVTPTKTTHVGKSWFSEYASLTGPGRDPAYTYEVAYLTKNKIPASLAHAVSQKRVATSVGAFRTNVRGATAMAGWVPFFPGLPFAQGSFRKVTLPSTVVSYLVGDGVRWSSAVVGPIRGEGFGAPWINARGKKYTPGSSTRDSYLTGVFSPGAVSGGLALREEDALIAVLPAFEDSDGRGGGEGDTGLKESLTAYVDGRRVISEPGGVFRIPAPKGKTLKLVHQAKRNASWWRTSTSSTGEWTAPLPKENRRFAPLMNIQYALAGRSMSGALPPGPQKIGLSVETFTNVKTGGVGVIAPKTLTLDWSIDGGKTWKKAAVKRDGKKATATFTPPAQAPGKSTMVSLRASASDGKGSTVKETVISAYEMTGMAPGSISGRQ